MHVLCCIIDAARISKKIVGTAPTTIPYIAKEFNKECITRF